MMKQLYTLLFVGVLLAWMQGAFAQVPVAVGSGSYASSRPLDQAAHPYLTEPDKWGDQTQVMENWTLNVTPENINRPVPTNKWYTNMIFNQFTGELWTYPSMSKADKNGLKISFPKVWSATGRNIVANSSLQIGGDFTPSETKLSNWSDWVIEFIHKDAASGKQMKVTEGQGMPFTWIEFSGISPTITLPSAGTFFTGSDSSAVSLASSLTSDHLGINLSGTGYSDDYAIYAPAGTTFTQNGNVISIQFSGAQHYLVVGTLSYKKDLETFKPYSLVKPTESKVSWNYNPITGKLATTYNISSINLSTGAANQAVLQGFLPHHYKKSDVQFAFDGTTYRTARGLMKMAEGSSFTIAYDFNGVVPGYPAPKKVGGANDYNPAMLKTMLDGLAAVGGSYGDDTYWGGKPLCVWAQYMEFAHETGDMSNFNTFKSYLKNALIDWYTYTPGEASHYFAYTNKYKSLIGANASYGSDQFNDHHFHYGYFTLATALLGMYDQEFLQQYGPMAKQVAKDYANWDRNDQNYPFMRMFNVWYGHSFAGGMGAENGGNGQESTSESMQSWGGLYLLGNVLGDNAMRDAGIFGYVLESRATEEYWFDIDHYLNANGDHVAGGDVKSSYKIQNYNYDYTKYDKAYSSNITADGIGWWTWFSGDPLHIQAIQWLPMSPVFKYLYKYPEYVGWDYHEMIQGSQFAKDANGNVVGWGKDGGTSGEIADDTGWGHVILSYMQIWNPDTTAKVFDWLWANNKASVKSNYSEACSYYFTHAHRTLGDIQWDLHTDISSGTVYKKDGTYSVVVFNPDNAEKLCTVYDSNGTPSLSPFKVPAHKLIHYQFDAHLDSIGLTANKKTIKPNETLQFSTEGFDQYGASFSTGTISWSASGGSVNASGLFSSATEGDFTVTATSGSVSANYQVHVSIQDPVLSSITLNPASLGSPVNMGQSIQFTAKGFDQFGEAFEFTPVWSTTGGASVSNGLLTGTSVANAQSLTASNGSGVSASLNFSVRYPLLNIAYKKPAVASSFENAGLIADNALDGNSGSRWASVAPTAAQPNVDPQFIYVDLQAQYNLEKVALNWETAAAKVYEIQVSDDAQSWTTIKTISNGAGGRIEIPVSATGRYVRIYGTQRATQWGYSLYDFEVYGTPTGAAPIMTSIVISPSKASITDQDTQTFTAKAYDQYGVEITPFTPTWSVLGGGTIDANGLYTPDFYKSRTNRVIASGTGISANAAIYVKETNHLAGISILPSTTASKTVDVAQGIPTTLSYQAFNQFGVDFPTTVSWSADAAAGTVDQNGVYIPGTPGVQQVKASSGSITGTFYANVRAIADVNLALGKPVVVSSVETANPALTGNLAVDGDETTTRWSSGWGNDNEWIYVDLGFNFLLNKVVVVWADGAFGTSYEIWTSTDKVNWTKAATKTNGQGGTDQLTINAVGRYVKMQGLSRSIINYGYSMNELKVYGASMIDPSSIILPALLQVENTSTTTGTSLNNPTSDPSDATGADLSFTVGGSSSYSTTVVDPNNYYLNLRYQSSADAQLVVSIDGTDVKTIALSNSNGNWQNAQERVALSKGNHTLKLTAQGAAFRLNSIDVVLPILSSLSLSPSNATIAAGSQQTFKADGIDQFGQAMETNFTWSITGGGTLSTSSTTSECTYSPLRPGSYTLSVSTASFNQSTSVTVNNGLPNIALNKTASASNGNGAGAVDGNTGTYWSSNDAAAHVDPQWVSVNLAAKYNLTGAYIQWEAACAKDYTFEASMDGTNWTVLKTFTDMPSVAPGQSRYDYIPNLTGTYKYVKINCTSRNLVYDYKIFELEVYGSPFLEPAVLSSIVVTPNAQQINVGDKLSFTATGKDQYNNDFPITGIQWSLSGGGTLTSNAATAELHANAAGNYDVKASSGGLTGSAVVKIRSLSGNDNIAKLKPSTASTGNASFANDGNPGTRWESTFADPQTLTIDLNGNYDLNSAILTWETASAKDYTIEGSLDNSQWTVLATRTNMLSTPNREDVISGISGTYRYIRMNGTARATVWGYSIFEFEVYGLLNQTISFDPITSKQVGDADFTLSATGGASGNAVSFTSSNSAVASISGNLVTIVGAGTCTVYADQAGDATYAPAKQVSQVLVVTPKLAPIVSWNGSSWSPASPSASDDAVIEGNYNGAGFPCINLTVLPGKQFTLASGNLNISGDFILKCNATDGPATFVNKGSLNLGGKAVVEQSLTGSLNASSAPNGRFWYVSSPVTGAKSATFQAAGANKLWYYSEATHGYTEITDNTSNLNVGWGYCARLGTDETVSFEGQLNDGPQSLNLTRQNDSYAKRGYNLVGNPYPSFLDWDQADTTNLSATIWRRTFDNTNMVFTTYNSKSKIGTIVNAATANNFIAPMQAFWVKVDSSDSYTGTLALNNAMRSHQNGKLMKGSDARPVLRLKMSNGKASDEAVLLVDANASNGLDAFDSEKMSNDNANIPEIYTLIGNKQIVINGLKELSDKQDIALGFRTGTANSFSLNASMIQNFAEGTSIILEDKLLGKKQNLIDQPQYQFSSGADTSNTRFVLHITKSTTGINDVAENENISIVKGANKLITVTLSGLQSYKGLIAVSSAIGQQVMVQELKGQETQFTANYPAGVYLFTVQVDGKKVTKKIAITD